MSNLSPGQYKVTVTDFYNCPYTETFNISQPAQLLASFNSNNVSSANLADASIEANPSGGDAPYTYSWSNGSTNQNLSNVDIGTYSVTITDVKGCAEFFDQLVIGNDCIASIVRQNNLPISSQIYQVAQFIQSNCIVAINEQVSFKAGDYIELVDDFEVIKRCGI